jgi:uncharacterized protein (TIGR00251 family)
MRHIKVKVYPEAAEDRVLEDGEKGLLVYVKAAARNGQANAAMLDLLRKKLKGESVRIVSGQRSRGKIVAVN